MNVCQQIGRADLAAEHGAEIEAFAGEVGLEALPAQPRSVDHSLSGSGFVSSG